MAKKTAKRANAKTTGGRPAKTKRAGGRGKALPDAKLAEALAAKVAELAGQMQKSVDGGGSLYDTTFEQRLADAYREANPGDALPDAAMQAIVRELLAAARGTIKPVRAAYLGPPFSFTHLAALERFGQAADLVPVETISGVFEEVNRGHCDYGVVPIENSTDGRIVDTLDMFTRLPLRICGEVQMRIHHHLMSRTPRGEVTEVYSKPQALSQCREWLARNMPNAQRHSVTSTSTAAQLAREKTGAAAIASRQAAVKYGLEVIAPEIEDSDTNVTRFAVIGGEEPARTGNDRTSLLLEIPHKPGSLADALAAFKAAKLNLTWIESFPLREEGGGAYLFFLDVEGHRDDAKVRKVVTTLEKVAKRLHVLGSYARSAAAEQ